MAGLVAWSSVVTVFRSEGKQKTGGVDPGCKSAGGVDPHHEAELAALPPSSGSAMNEAERVSEDTATRH